MQELNLPKYEFRIRSENGKQQIFDTIRKKFVVLTPEEWVRQNFTQYLVQEKNYPASLIAVEMKITYNRKPQRGDIIIYDKTAKPHTVVECKAPSVSITQEVFYQAARYNSQLMAKYIIVTNGLQHYCCQMDYTNGQHKFLQEVPDWN